MAEHGYEWIEFTVRNGVATITFNAPQFGNALGLKGLQEFLDALYKAEEQYATVRRQSKGYVLLARAASPSPRFRDFVRTSRRCSGS